MIRPTSLLPPESQIRYWSLAVYFRYLRQHLRYVDYGAAEGDCELIAARLLELYSPDELRDFNYLPIPRGGLIVLGMLAYTLDLPASRLQATRSDPARPLCIVDDCALSGHRFHRFLSGGKDEHVIFAHLYSHPRLRREILAREPRVRHCVAAQDLRALPRGDEEPHHYLGDNRYWDGATELITFAWSEPEMQLLDPFTGEVENRWRFTPPHRCLKNKAELGLPPRPRLDAGWQAPQAIVTGWFDGVLWLLQTETEQVYQLHTLAADAWRALAVYGSEEATLAFLRRHYPQEEKLPEEVKQILATLVAQKLIERVE